jgi:uncharacterized protein (DUF1778 family)
MGVNMATKTQRLAFRVTGEQEAMIRRAAALEGVSLTDFLARCAQEGAKRSVREHETITLRGEAAAQFARALLEPPAASNPELLRALRESRETVEDRTGGR